LDPPVVEIRLRSRGVGATRLECLRGRLDGKVLFAV